jgi:hypothetical protein
MVAIQLQDKDIRVVQEVMAMAGIMVLDSLTDWYTAVAVVVVQVQLAAVSKTAMHDALAVTE